MDKIKKIASYCTLLAVVFTQLISCQMKKELPQFHVEMCHPESKYRIEPVYDKIKTLEGNSASFPYGGSSGEWGSSHKSWTEQYGTPIGADITYYVGYEDTFYRLNVDFPVETMEDLTKRFYANNEDLEYDEDLKEYVYERKPNQYRTYTEFRDLVFGFAPKGIVVVWLRYGATQKELGRYQADVVKDDAALEKKLFASWSMNRKQVHENYFNPDASPEKWDNYRRRYVWRPIITSTKPNFKLFEVMTGYFNAESEIAVRPISLNPAKRERAIPKAITFFWETGKGEKFEGRAFFDWQKTNEQFKNEGTGDNEIQIKISDDNSGFEVFLNNETLETVNKRVYLSNQEFKESYK
ncbi:DUF2931 family protein [Flavobacterium sp. AJR]|uniref:DUF2931 family protein n=1 Tax=Flavobacterium sp. AJR TaxID=1979369 RepID=UPI000A3D70D9|nr:DUF2931 family protein [Flavobacterium sp. AJR]OUL60275.1 hypothetical protein B8T70_21305 [Flavobacterium sp. AJR]